MYIPLTIYLPLLNITSLERCLLYDQIFIEDLVEIVKHKYGQYAEYSLDTIFQFNLQCTCTCTHVSIFSNQGK